MSYQRAIYKVTIHTTGFSYTEEFQLIRRALDFISKHMHEASESYVIKIETIFKP